MSDLMDGVLDAEECQEFLDLLVKNGAEGNIETVKVVEGVPSTSVSEESVSVQTEAKPGRKSNRGRIKP